ncbi:MULTISPECIES: hypothetical protein [unclassified Brachybacterium]|uniref:hypothetical protein n=1 Tax=unclassified Brachybacterium TaxID=2623841 RepID=UPI003F8F4C19
MSEVSFLLCAPSASCISAQAAGRLAVHGVDLCPAPYDSPHLEDLAALAPDQENDIP